MPTRYHLKRIRTLLIEGFTAEELRRFCFYEPEFNPVYDELAEGDGKADIADKVIEFAAQKFKLDLVLAWAKENNSTRYDQHQPYQELIPAAITGAETPQNSPRIRATPVRAFQETNPANPFIDGPPVPPEKFIGREREIDIILDRLANHYNRGGSTVSGPFGVGKTSLLHYLRNETTRKSWAALSPETAKFIYIPSGLIFPFSELGFWEYLFSELDEWLGPSYGTDKIISTLESGKLPSRVNITRFFTKLGESKENKFVVVLLDGFDLLMGEINKSGVEAGLGFLHTLRALLNLPAPRGFSLITSSERELFDLFANVPWFGSGFYSNMANLPLAPFDDRQIDTLIDSYLATTEINFDEHDRNYLKKTSQGHPKRLQQEAFALFEKKVNTTGETKMTTPEQSMFAMGVLTQAVSFLFDEARKILAERRERRQKMEEPDDRPALPDGVQASAKEKFLELKPANFDDETRKEVDHLLKLIAIQQDHRRKAEVKINKLGGILFVPPNVRVELESAEDEILTHTQKLKKLLEKVYNQPIHLDGLG
ncbi:MAG: ATP-binding protein [Anaerolineales bacterium]|nr:ATP-binding protein [Anaerolineales bacterium]